jgi:hypothetical protein
MTAWWLASGADSRGLSRRFLSTRGRRGLVGVALLGALAGGEGCATSRPPAAVPGDTRPSRLVVSSPVDHVDVLAREPMIVEHPDGTLFVTGYGSAAPALWKSRDQGTTWTRVDVGSEANGAIGNSDVDLAMARDGTLYFVTMVFDNKKLEGTSISIGVSKDAGGTWSWTPLSKNRFDDRPWVAVASDGTAHVIWNDGSGVCHAVSEDSGRTWTNRPRIHPQGGSSHLAVGPNREVAVRVTPLSASGNRFDEGVDLVAVSIDGGTTWQKHPAPGTREWRPLVDTTVTPPRWVEPPLPRWVEPLAWDAQGALYALWTNSAGLWVGRSLDRGLTWKTWRLAKSRDVLFYPYLIARGQGDLAATWFSSRGAELYAHVARIEVGQGDAQPRFVESAPFQIDSWARGGRSEDPPTRDSGGEYLAMAFLHDDGLAAVSPIQNRNAKRFGFSYWRVGVR